MDAGAAIGADPRAMLHQNLLEPRAGRVNPVSLISLANLPVLRIEFPCYRSSNSLLSKSRELSAKFLQRLHILTDRMMKTVSAR
jgi:hypothetical protein